MSASVPDLSMFRESKGIALESIAEHTRISLPYLRAIESRDFDRLPGGVYTRSYIRQYAQAIDYDEWDLLASYVETTGPEVPVPPQAEPGRFRSCYLSVLPLLRRLGEALKD